MSTNDGSVSTRPNHPGSSCPVSRNGFPERNSFPSEQQKREQAANPSWGPRFSARRETCSRDGRCLCKDVSHIRMSESPDSEGVENTLFLTNHRFACMCYSWVSKKGKWWRELYMYWVSLCPNAVMYFTFTINNSMELLLFITHRQTFHRWGKWDPERLNYLPKTPSQ